MATGSQSSIQALLRRLVPAQWFDRTATPYLDALLQSAAGVFAFIFDLIGYARLQTRIATASDGWLDLIANDFYGGGMPRRAGELDPAYRTRILNGLFVHRTTRPAMSNVLEALTGHKPKIFEPMNPNDVGGLNQPLSRAYFGVMRAGSMAMPFECFITVYRDPVPQPSAGGAAFFNAARWSAFSTPGSHGYFGTMAGQQPSPTNEEIMAAINATRPAATICWVAIKNWIDQDPLILIDQTTAQVTGQTSAGIQGVFVAPPQN